MTRDETIRVPDERSGDLRPSTTKLFVNVRRRPVGLSKTEEPVTAIDAPPRKNEDTFEYPLQHPVASRTTYSGRSTLRALHVSWPIFSSAFLPPWSPPPSDRSRLRMCCCPDLPHQLADSKAVVSFRDGRV